ncbi:MAG: exo-alpha-sialidase, partial [Pseudomonadota bacterium]
MKRRTFLGGALAALAIPAAAAQSHSHGAAAPTAKAARPTLAVNVAFGADGRLWRVRHGAEGVLVDWSDDGGGRFAPAMLAAPEPPAADGELAPEIAVTQDGVIYVAYTLARSHNPIIGHVRLVRSRDGGRSFTPAATVNDNLEEITHRFQSLVVDAAGVAHLIWIDKRDLEAARRARKPYRGAAVYYARCDGTTIGANRKVADHSCECCRLALALDSDGVPVALWRHVFEDGSRDHALARLDGSPARRATFEGWRIDACPHHGPALAVGSDGIRHLAWYTAAGDDARILYQAQHRDGRPLAPPRRLGGDQAGFPALLAIGTGVILAWKEFDGSATRVFVQHASGNGWSTAAALASSGGPSDRPRLVAQGGRAFLSWNTRDEGYR